jgi:predicted amidophosphoribosyltransferase
MLGKQKNHRTICPSCRQIIDLDRRYRRKELVVCPQCNQEFEVVREHPQVVDFLQKSPQPTSGKKYHKL